MIVKLCTCDPSVLPSLTKLVKEGDIIMKLYEKEGL